MTHSQIPGNEIVDLLAEETNLFLPKENPPIPHPDLKKHF